MNVEEMISWAETPLFWVGAFTVASLTLWLLYRLLTGFRIWVLGNGQLLSPKLGKWLARRGFAMMLISRSQEKLDDVARSIGKHVKHDEGMEGRVHDGGGDQQAGLLVHINNVGVSYPYPEYYLHIPDLDNVSNLYLKMGTLSYCMFSMTRLVLPRMCERSKGVILNISSASGMYPLPLLTVYSATKAFVDFFSRGLQEEYRRQGILIQSVLPFFVVTKMTRIKKPTLDKPTPERYVAAELATVGLQSQTNGYFPHAVMGWVTTKLVPTSIVIFLGATMNRLQRTGYLRRRKLREQKNGQSLKTE
uniref:3-ketoacyl-CoA reductase n=1 Tax=Haplochromis burtoni TaxID=8153 RepID=A0A3Q2WUX4_HAPBU